jgi:signal transduction histidine kinase
MLHSDGYVIDHVADAAMALAAIGNALPDLIFCPVDSKGCRLVHALKIAPGSAQVPVIMLVPPIINGVASGRLAGLDAGAEAVLTMPLNRIKLHLMVRNLLRLKSAAHHSAEAGVLQIDAKCDAKFDVKPDAMLIRLAWAREQERTSLARELHDEVGQRLALLKIDLHHLRSFVQGPDGLSIWQDADAEVSTLSAWVRSIAVSLRPPALDCLGLEAALRQLLERQFAHGAAHYVFEYAGLPAKMEPAMELALYRIVQESVANIVRHASATSVVVEINNGDIGGELELIIRDNGCGFDAGIMRSGSGLQGIKERVQLLGGLFLLDTAPQRGTRLVVSLPLMHAQGESLCHQP